jgi:integrase
LRTPSELRNLELSDIDWTAKTIRIKEQMTTERTIPLFPELVDALKNWDGSKIQLTGYSRRFNTLLRSIDIKPWPRLWHYMRASRQTELADRFPTHVVCKWIGNSEKVASDHYPQITDDMIAEAVRDPRSLQ